MRELCHPTVLPIPGTKNTHRYRHRGLKTADLESRRELPLSFLALITLASPTLGRREQLIGRTVIQEENYNTCDQLFP